MLENINQLQAVRHEKLQKLIALGVNPYPNRVNRTHRIVELWDRRDDFTASEQKVIITGRIDAIRRQGKVGFGNICDQSGRIQIFVKQDLVGEESYEIFKLLDLGDIIQVQGKCFVTRMGEYSLRVQDIVLLSKNLRPLPVVKQQVVDGIQKRYDEFVDIELRYRKRYLDLLLNPEVKRNFEIRALIISEIRKFLNEEGFLEVETPVLQPLYGGAYARPFITHHNTLDIDLYLRIALELYLKRLLIGNMEKVYEIGKNFRNEGMDRNHNPEFSMVEIYQAYTDYSGMMDLTEAMITGLARKINGREEVRFQDRVIELERPWKRASMIDLIREKTGYDAADFDFARISAYCSEHDIEIPPGAGPGKLIEAIFARFVEAELIEPTFVIDFPSEISPLAKHKPGNTKLVERFELFINGNEYGNAFTELNDPVDQRQRFEAQAELRKMGDLEANPVDEDFLEALEYGMPPAGGLGIGIDRLVMLFTNNTSIKEVILFPTMKPE
ncbi:MAG: lysine--tRNA ligase [Candidatus Cloacimonetes bacterium]|nr:lysine--tRNA ligase [Candidatus Cloacimonadota bacterium]